MFQNYKLTIFLPVLIFTFGLVYLLISIAKSESQYKKRLYRLLILNFFAMFYFIAGLQTGSTITVYIQNTRNFPLPASAFNMLYCGFVVLLAPFFSWLWGYYKSRSINIAPHAKLLAGILLGGMGIIIFALTARYGYFFEGVIAGYLFLSAGELVLTPAIYAAISNYAPEELKGTMVGAWFLFIGMGSYLSSIISTLSTVFAHRFFSESFYYGQFMFIGIIIFLAAIVLRMSFSKIIIK